MTMDTTTQRLMNRIRDYDSISEFLVRHKHELKQMSLDEFFEELMTSKGLKKADVVEATDLNRSYVYSVLRLEKKPSRDKAIRLALALKADYHETNELLRICNYGSLQIKNARDAVIIYSLERKLKIIDVNIILDNLKYPLI